MIDTSKANDVGGQVPGSVLKRPIGTKKAKADSVATTLKRDSTTRSVQIGAFVDSQKDYFFEMAKGRDIEALTAMAQSYIMLGDTEEARKLLEECKEIRKRVRVSTTEENDSMPEEVVAVMEEDNRKEPPKKRNKVSAEKNERNATAKTKRKNDSEKFKPVPSKLPPPVRPMDRDTERDIGPCEAMGDACLHSQLHRFRHKCYRCDKWCHSIPDCSFELSSYCGPAGDGKNLCGNCMTFVRGKESEDLSFPLSNQSPVEL